MHLMQEMQQLIKWTIQSVSEAMRQNVTTQSWIQMRTFEQNLSYSKNIIR